MDLGSFSEVHDHAEYVQWNDQGAPEVWLGPESYETWTPECAQDYDAHWGEDTQRLSAIAEADASHQNFMDAIKGKGGKGKGK